MGSNKFRANKKSTRGQKKAWKKNQSSSYNPKCKRFRDDAKKRAKFGYQAGNSKLTESAVTHHNNKLDDAASTEMDTASVGGLSFVSTFSNCTNPAFNRLLTHWHSNSAFHKEMLAVLAAVTEVIKGKGGNETETEYFAALMTTLEIAETDDSRSAIISLIHMIVKKLPVSVLKLHFSKSCIVFKDLLTKYIDSELNSVLRNLLGCIFCFLKVQSIKWNTSFEELFMLLLEYSIHQKPKVRKFAQQIISYLLHEIDKDDTGEKAGNPAAAKTARFCVQKMENAGSAGSTTFHVLNMLKDILGCFPRSSLKLCCETVLRIMTLSNAVVITHCLKVLQGTFAQLPKPDNLPDELNARIITALYDYQPNINDVDLHKDWLLTMEYAFINLYKLSPALCISHLPKFFKVAVSGWLSDKINLHPAVTSTLKNIIQKCVVPEDSQFQQMMLDDPIDNPVHKMFKLVEGALGYQYYKAWKEVLISLTVFFNVIAKYSYPIMTKCLQSLADLHDSVGFPHLNELDKAIGMAIRRMGPETVLKAVPLQIDCDKLDFPRSWLLPLLRDNVQESQLGFFIRYFLPLVSQLKKKVAICERENRVVEAKTYDLLCSQMWSLLPGFCTLPTDLITSWPTIARVLGVTLSEQPSLRITLLSSIRIIISKNLENEENRAELAKFSKNFIPIFLNLYTTESKDKVEENNRLAVLDTLKVYLNITDTELSQNFFARALEKLKDSSSFSQQALLDISKVLLPYGSPEQIKQLYEFCKPHLQDSHHTVQKKTYGVMRELCSNSSENCKDFVKMNLDDLKSVLLTSLSSSSPPSKALRLHCLKSIVEYLSIENKDFIVAIVPEAILCTKENALKARESSYDLLAKIGEIMKKWLPENTKGAMRDYLQMLLAGFTGGPHMISATIQAIGHVLYVFKDDLDSDLIHLLVENVCLLLTSQSREIVTSALSFVKILFSTVSKDDLAQHVEHMVSCISNVSEENQRSIRFKAKELFVRLVRKFGYEMISKLAPEQFQKQLTNIRKVEARKKKRSTLESGSYELEKYPKKEKSDHIDDILEDSDDEQDKDEKQKSAPTPGKMWIEERENEIVDFMDPSARKKILASKPKQKTESTPSSTSFEMSSDGRLIITDETDDVDSKKRRKRKSDDSESYQKGKKRKFSKGSDDYYERDNKDDNDDDDDKDEVQSTFKPVLKGIHRTIKKVDKAPGAAYKAKKASGDVKRGKVDPYAYIPLNKEALNKRKRKKFDGQFKSIVKAAKHGASKGAKQKARKGGRRK